MSTKNKIVESSDNGLGDDVSYPFYIQLLRNLVLLDFIQDLFHLLKLLCRPQDYVSLCSAPLDVDFNVIWAALFIATYDFAAVHKGWPQVRALCSRIYNSKLDILVRAEHWAESIVKYGVLLANLNLGPVHFSVYEDLNQRVGLLVLVQHVEVARSNDLDQILLLLLALEVKVDFS